MKKVLALSALFVALALFIAVQRGVIYARLTGTQPTSADIVCWGPDGAEVCVVDGGSLVPTTTHDTTLGTSSLEWLAVNVASVTASGSIIKTMPATETIGAAATITANACGGVKRLTATAARTTNTTDTFTAPSAALAGCVMDVVNLAPGFAITLDNNANFQSAGAADVVLGSSDTVRVGCTGASGFWFQIGDTGNN